MRFKMHCNIQAIVLNIQLNRAFSWTYLAGHLYTVPIFMRIV